MSVIDYVVDILLIVIIFLQVRPHRLTVRSIVLPLLLLAAAGVVYFRPTSLRGNDLFLIVVLTFGGALLGVLSGAADNLHASGDGGLVDRATVFSVLTWIIGMGFRLGFAYYAFHSGADAVARFSADHNISGARIWTTALFAMACGQVLFRVGSLQFRRIRVLKRPDPVTIGDAFSVAATARSPHSSL
jgi:hypothetical protein